MSQLEQTWSTGCTAQAKALSYWQEVICENLLRMQIDSANETHFHGQIAKCAFGPLKANFISVSEQRVWRTRARSGGVRDGIFHLIHVRKGVQHVEQYGRNIKVDAGNSLLVDCSSGFSFNFPEGVEALVLEIRRDWLLGWLPEPEDAVARVIDGSSGWGRTLASVLANLTPTSVASSDLPQTAIAEQIAVMLALAAAPSRHAPTTHKRALLKRVTETLRERCHEPGLDPAAVAKALGLSRRYIHVLFAAAGKTFTQELYALRLQRAQRLLDDRRFDGVGIGEIAWNCGFSEPSHFTRRFRECFGVPPTEYRRAVA
jgi:AraC-like DNA-binding protein